MKKESTEEKDILPILRIIFIVLLILCAILLSVFLLIWTAKRTRPAGADPQVGQKIEKESPAEDPATPDNIESTELPEVEDAEPADTPEPETQEPENTEEPVTPEEPEATEAPSYANMIFVETNESVTAKDATNLRNVPSQGEDSQILMTLQNGQVATRVGISETGWSKLEYNGETYYAVSRLLTTDLTVTPEPQDDGVKTVFAECNEKVCPKIEVNLRTLPSVTNPDSQVVVTIRHGDIVTRTGINTDVGWSRVEYNGQVLYCVSSYVYVVEE